MSELKSDKTFVFGEECEAYKKYEVDATIAAKDAEITELKEKLAEKESWVKMLGEGEATLSLELEKTKQKLEDAKATAYAESVDAGMENRRLKRALYKAIANWAHHRVFVRLYTNEKAWENVESKCRAKAEEYK